MSEEFPIIEYREIQPYFLKMEDIKSIISFLNSPLKLFQDFYKSRGMLDFSHLRRNFCQNVPKINLNLESSSVIFDLVESKRNFELSIIRINIPEENLTLNDLNSVFNERSGSKDEIQIKRSPKLESSLIGNLDYIHIQLKYKHSKIIARKVMNFDLTSYALCEVDNDDNGTFIDVSIILKHDTDYTIIRDGIKKILIDRFIKRNITIKIFNLPRDIAQINILEKTLEQLEVTLDIIGITKTHNKRLGESDPKKALPFRAEKTHLNNFDFENIEEFWKEAKKESYIFTSIQFAFTYEEKFPNLIFECNYSLKELNATVKLEHIKIFNDDIEDSLFDDEKEKKTYTKFTQLNDTQISLGQKFYISNILLKALINNINHK